MELIQNMIEILTLRETVDLPFFFTRTCIMLQTSYTVLEQSTCCFKRLFEKQKIGDCPISCSSIIIQRVLNL